MKSLLGALFLILVLAAPARAALVFPLRDFEVRVEYQNAKTRTISRSYVKGRPYYIPGNYHWKGVPIGLLIIDGRLLQKRTVKHGRVLNRCKFQVGRALGRQWVAIDRHRLVVWRGATIVEAGPCIQWNNGRVVVTWKEEGFDPWFVAKKAWRNVVCIDNGATEVAVFRYYGSLTAAMMEPKMRAYGMQTCMNLDGGSTMDTGRSVVTIGLYPR